MLIDRRARFRIDWWLSTAVGVLALTSGCARKELFSAPARDFVPTAVQPHTELTTLTLVTSIPYAAAQKLIQTHRPSAVPLSGDGHIACTDVPHVDPGGIETRQSCTNVPYCNLSLTRQVCGTRSQCVNLPSSVRLPKIRTSQQCADYDWSATITPDGLPTVSKSGDAIHLELPAKVEGHAGVKGDLAKLLALNAKSFEAHLRPGVDVTLSLGANWCPVATVTPTNRWVSDASVEVVGRNCLGIDLGPLGHPEICAGPVNVGLTDLANSAIASHQKNLSDIADSVFNCDTIRQTISSQWHAFAVPLPTDLPNAGPLFLNIVPKGFAFSGLKADSDAARISLKVWADTAVESTAVSDEPIALPEVSPVDEHASRLTVHLSANVPYSVVTEALRGSVLSRTYAADTPAGRVSTRIDDVSVYPSSRGLVIGLSIDAKLPSRMLDTKGWVYLIGKPVPADSGSAIEIQELSYGTVLDNEAWKLLVSVFDTEILKALRANSRVELKDSITQSANRLADQINKISVKGAKIFARLPTASLDDIELGDQTLLATVAANMDFNLEVVPDGLLAHDN